MITIPDDTPAHELVILKARVAELLAVQQRKLIRPGKIASFIGRDGLKYYIRIDKVNIKTVSGMRCTPDGIVSPEEAKGAGWRVSISMLTPVIEAPKIADSLPPPKIEADKPLLRTMSALAKAADTW